MGKYYDLCVFRARVNELSDRQDYASDQQNVFESNAEVRYDQRGYALLWLAAY